MVCPICKQVKTKELPSGNDTSIINCPNCIRYEITGTASVAISVKEKDMELSFAIRQRNLNNENVVVNSENRATIINGIRIPETIKEISEYILKEFYNDSRLISKGLSISIENMVAYAIKDYDTLQAVVEYVEIMRWCSKSITYGSGGALIKISKDGIKHAESLISPNKDSILAFVAMSFKPELEAIYEEAIKGAIKHCGLEPVRIDDKQFNGEIVKEISDEIDRSRFIVADFTDNRPGVYFEAGYATGKGLPVIYCCKECEKGDIHFDINHFKFIYWENAEDLKDELIKRIKATILNQ